jgi:RNA polymerase sigma factor (sigma-70 family)
MAAIRHDPEVDIGEERPRLDGPDPGPEFVRLFDAHAADIHRYLARRVGTDQAHDLVSETFLVALRERHSYSADGGARAWLFGIATNLVRRHARQQTRMLRATARLRFDAVQTDHDARVAEQLDAQTIARRIAPAIAELADGDRDVLFLTFWAQLTTVEIAEALAIPVGTVRSRLHRVRRLLRTRAAVDHLPREEELR